MFYVNSAPQKINCLCLLVFLDIHRPSMHSSNIFSQIIYQRVICLGSWMLISSHATILRTVTSNLLFSVRRLRIKTLNIMKKRRILRQCAAVIRRETFVDLRN